MADPATSRPSLEKSVEHDEKDRPPSRSSVKKSRPSTSSTRAGEAPDPETAGQEQDVEKGSVLDKGDDGADSQDEFLVTWKGADDPDMPWNWSNKRRWNLVLPLSIITLVSPLASSMFAPAIPLVLEAFHETSENVGSFIVSVYVLGYAFGPLIIAPLSEIYGRAVCYHVSNVCTVVFTILCAESQSIGMLIAMRFLAGISGSTPITIGGGTLADLFNETERGKAMALWSLGPLLGPVIGPVAGGFLAQAEGWRWVFWVLAMAQGVSTVYSAFALKETYHPVLLARRAAKLRSETGDARYQTVEERRGEPKARVIVRAVKRPVKMLFLHPIVAAMAFHMATTYAYLYLLMTTLPLVFEGVYGFSSGTVGLTYLGLGVGCLLALAAFGALSDRLVKARVRATGRARPEDRLPYMTVGQFFTPIGLIWYGWTAAKHVQWIAPIIGTSFLGLGMLSTFFPINAYLLDAFGQYAASAIAATTVFRSLAGALVPLAGQPMYERLGLGWGNTTLAFISIALSWIPFWLLLSGEKMRQRFKLDL